jgi:hypothetical protein
MAHECEEAGDCKSFVAVSEKLEVYGVMVIEVAQEGNDGVNGYHNEDANDTMLMSQRWKLIRYRYILLLLIGLQVMGCMPQDQEASHNQCDCTEGCGEYKAKMMESELLP